MPEDPIDQEPLSDHVLPPGKSTGPRSADGKERSSQNARKHGCTSRKLLLPGEREEEYRALLADWLADFQPQAATAFELVVQTAQAQWFYLRVQKQCDLAEAGLQNQNPLEWSDEQWKLRERLGRYRTTAERTFYRALTAIEARRKSRMAECDRAERLQLMAQKIELQHLHRLEQGAQRERRAVERNEEKARKEAEKVAKEAAKAEAAKNRAVSAAKRSKKQAFGVAEQWVEVRITEGLTTTEYVPSNAELIEEIEKSEVEPEMVYRRLNFPDGVPPEYGWTNLHDPARCETTAQGGWCPLCSVKERGGHGIQRMTYQTWRDVIEREETVPGGHAGPTGVGNLPRPKERGGEVPFAEMGTLE